MEIETMILTLTTAADVARVLAITCDTETLAGILNALLCCEEEARLDDEQCRIGQTVFDVISDLKPEAVSVAQGR